MVRALGAGITALVVGFWIGPSLILLLKKIGAKQAFRDKEEVGKLADLHIDKTHTPTMGGMLIFFSVLTPYCGLNPMSMCTALITYILLTSVGFADDFLKISKKNSKGLSGKYKLLGQLIATGVALFFLLGPFANDLNGAGDEALGSSQKMREFWIPFVSYEDTSSIPILSIGTLSLLYLLTLTGTSNAINLTDGLDGLAIGCTVTVALTYAIMAYASGNFFNCRLPQN